MQNNYSQKQNAINEWYISGKTQKTEGLKW